MVNVKAICVMSGYTYRGELIAEDEHTYIIVDQKDGKVRMPKFSTRLFYDERKINEHSISSKGID